MELRIPKFALVLSSEKPTQFFQGSWSLIITSSILLKIAAAVPEF